MERIYHNEMLEFKYKGNKNILRIISEFKLGSDIDLKQYIKKFINFRTFPYVNSTYGTLVNDFYSELSDCQKKEILGILKKRLCEMDEARLITFRRLRKKEIKKVFNLDYSLTTNKEKLYSEISGGHYGEMFLNHIFLTLGYQKIISKLYLEWGNLTPTGIDVPYIDLKEKVLLLGESKLYKKIENAIDNVLKDIGSIYNGNKFDREIIEWNAKIMQMPEEVRDFFQKNNINEPLFFKNNFNKIIIVGMVIGNKINEEKLKQKLDDIVDVDKITNFEIILLVIPIESKDELVKLSIECIEEMIKEVGAASE